jgi:hypothetical protein
MPYGNPVACFLSSVQQLLSLAILMRPFIQPLGEEEEEEEEVSSLVLNAATEGHSKRSS